MHMEQVPRRDKVFLLLKFFLKSTGNKILNNASYYFLLQEWFKSAYICASLFTLLRGLSSSSVSESRHMTSLSMSDTLPLDGTFLSSGGMTFTIVHTFLNKQTMNLSILTSSLFHKFHLDRSEIWNWVYQNLFYAQTKRMSKRPIRCIPFLLMYHIDNFRCKVSVFAKKKDIIIGIIESTSLRQGRQVEDWLGKVLGEAG